MTAESMNEIYNVLSLLGCYDESSVFLGKSLYKILTNEQKTMLLKIAYDGFNMSDLDGDNSDLFKRLSSNVFQFKFLKRIPDSIQYFSKLYELTVINGCEEISSSVGKLKGLTRLNLYNSKLKKLPDFIDELQKLGHISVNNQLEEFPLCLSRIHSLVSINLTDNKIRNIPEELSNMSKLRFLHLGGNPISEFPNSLTFLRNLTIENTKISQLPSMPNLKYLSVHNTKIKNLNLNDFPKLVECTISKSLYDVIDKSESKCEFIIK